MNDTLRDLMRRIALGLPVIIPVVTAPFNVGGCYGVGGCPEQLQAVVVEHANDGGELTEAECRAACEPEWPGARCGVIDEERVQCLFTVRDCPPAGRPPARAPRLDATAVPSDDPIAAWLRDAALMEAASVPAFAALAADLRRFGAPEALVEAARDARDDEARHAAAMTRLLAARVGPVSVRATAPCPRSPSLEALATANRVDGCEGEAWAAVEAAVQSTRAEDPALRAAMATIAREEASHARLSFAIDDWARLRLTPAASVRIDAAAATARAERRAALAARRPPSALGLPSADEAPHLLDALLPT